MSLRFEFLFEDTFVATCKTCGKNYMFMLGVDGKCNACIDAEIAENQAKAAAIKAEADAVRAAGGGYSPEEIAQNQTLLRAKAIMLTTENAPTGLTVTDRLGIVTAECVFGMHLFKDLFAVGRDIFGGRSEAMQNTLKDARNTALEELRIEAAKLGADAVIAVDLDYSEISGGGKSMLFLVASGTAVRLAGGKSD
jgi:uncharacterized protein YbjQ (UPF0145 family)